MTAERTWGQGSPPVEAIVAAALRLVDEHGLAALTTRRLAAEMGIHQPTIYRRVADLDELLGLVANAIMTEAGTSDVDRSDWRAWLRDTALRVRRAWDDHPNAAPLVDHGGPLPAITAFIDSTVAAFTQAGFDDDAALGPLQAYLSYVFGEIVVGSMSMRPRHRPAPRRVTPDEAPHLARLQSTLAGRSGDVEASLFAQGLDVVLKGIDAAPRSSGSRRPRRR